MRYHTQSESGFGVVAVVLVVVAIAIVGAAAFKVSQSSAPGYKSAGGDAKSPGNSSLKSKESLTSASKSLDAEPIDKNLDPKQLDLEMNDIL